MGNWLFAPNKGAFDMELEFAFGEEVSDGTKAGEVYLLIHSQGLESVESSQAKRAHYSILIDVGGDSTNDDFVGLELHLLAKIATRKTYFPPLVKVARSKEKLISSHLLGKLELGSPFPADWAYDLYGQARHIYKDLVKKNGDTWNPTTNCQQFARVVATEMLHFPWPAHIPVIGDEAPIIVELAMRSLSTLAKCS